MWLMEIEIWRLQREYAAPKEETEKSPDNKELLEVTYPEAS
jgi:hypothetical protein